MRFNSNDLIEMSNAVRALALHAVACANSGHVGIILGASGIITTVFANFLRPGLDRFVWNLFGKLVVCPDTQKLV